MVREEPTTIVVQVQPNARQNKVTSFKNGIWHLMIAAPPVKGKANEELIKFLSDILGVAKSNLTIEKGMTSKRKIIAVNGLTQSQAVRRIENLILQAKKADLAI